MDICNHENISNAASESVPIVWPANVNFKGIKEDLARGELWTILMKELL